MLYKNKKEIKEAKIQKLYELSRMYLKEIDKFKYILETITIKNSEDFGEKIDIENYIDFLYKRYDYIISILINKEAEMISNQELQTLSYY